VTGVPFKVTGPRIAILTALQDTTEKVHGWHLGRVTGVPTPTVYVTLERLRALGWVEYEWETERAAQGRPLRRLYWLTDVGRDAVRDVLARPRRRALPGGGGSR
jgi:DNA-binding PadR family transcriptional regulator